MVGSSKVVALAGAILCFVAFEAPRVAAESAGPRTPEAPTSVAPAQNRPPVAMPLSPAAASSVAAEFELAARLSSGRGVTANPPAAAALMEHLASTGNPAAQMIVGEYYFGGFGVEPKPAVAASWMQKAADQNFTRAQAELAFLYIRGVGVPQDYGQALRLARAAADRGDPEGEDALGVLYSNGWGVGADGAEATKWLTRAINKKFTSAMFHMGEAYRDGKPFPQDKVLAYAWFAVAAANTPAGPARDNAARRRDELALTVLPDDLAQARKLAADWKPGDDLTAKRAALGAASTTASADDQKGPSESVVISGPAPVAGAGQAPILDLPAAFNVQSEDFDVQPDGSYTLDFHSEVEIKNEAGAKNYAQHPLTYGEPRAQVDVVEAYTLKRNGKKLPVDASAIHTQMVPGVPDVPMFNDERQKVVIFPNVEVGDVTVLTARYTSKPLIPGLFSMTLPFDRTIAQHDVRVSVKLPKTMQLSTETHDVKFEQRSEGDRTIYEWRFANPNPIAENVTALDPRDRWPRIYVSTFRNYDQLASAYAAMIQSKSAVTPEIQKTADEITKGVSDRRKQAELIYNWVSRHIRYVAIEFGVGAIVPHAAAEVLTNGYGDCKDHSTLFQSLLKAKGISSTVVLINLGASYALGTAPSMGVLNHAITWLPDFNLYADTTAGVAPFGTLPFAEYGKPVVHATASPPALRRTPLLAANAASVAIKTKASLGADGRLIGDSETTSTGPFSVELRLEALSIQGAGSDQAAKYVLRQKNFDGTGKFEFASPLEPAQTYRIAGHFETNPRQELLSGNSFALPIGLALGAVPGDFLMGLLSFRDFRGDEPTPCFSGHEVEELSLELPENRHLRELPKGADVRNKYLSFKSEWSMSGRTVTVRREFTSTMDQPVCIGEVRALAARALNDIRKDYNTAVALATN